MSHAPLLEARGVSKRFGGVQALFEVSVCISHNQIHGLIGPNGAGKTTFFNALTGFYQPDSGDFALNGTPYWPQAIHEVARAGIARTFQNIRLFSNMSALENVMIGRHARTQSGLWSALLRTRRFKTEENATRQHAQTLLDQVGLGHCAHLKAGHLSYGDQRRLEIARALATEPKLLALDEPAAGMNATEKQTLRTLIQNLRHQGQTILLIEHDVKLVMGLCDEITVLDQGRLIAHGSPTHIQNHPAVIAAYLGSTRTK
jgi:branched-chain amino acid transport system ATP-binding protein